MLRTQLAMKHRALRTSFLVYPAVNVLGDESERQIMTQVEEAHVQSSKSSVESTEWQSIEENGGDHTSNEAKDNHNATDLVVRMISGD